MADIAVKTKAPSFSIEADGSRLRTLVKPVEGTTGTLDKIRVRKPKYTEVMNFGDPAALIVFESRSALPYEDMAIVRQYMAALIQTPSGETLDPVILEQCDYLDAIALKDAVMSFFK